MFLKWFLLPGSIYWPRRKLSLNELCNIMQQLIFGIYNTIEIILITLSGNFLTHMFNSPYTGPLINKVVHPWLNHQYPKWWQWRVLYLRSSNNPSQNHHWLSIHTIYNGESNPIWDSDYLSICLMHGLNRAQWTKQCLPANNENAWYE